MTGSLTSDTALALMQVSQMKAPQSVLAQNHDRIEDSAREFEAVFVSEMMKPMFEGIKADALFGGGKGEEIFRGMMLQEYGKKIASLDIIGIQTQVQHKLIELQAAQVTAQDQAKTILNGEDTSS